MDQQRVSNDDEEPVKTKEMNEARRNKKRVSDRVSQRHARARTKTRIAELESLVAKLTKENGNETCRALMEELDQSRAECVSLRKKLATIASIASVNPPGGSNSTTNKGNESDSSAFSNNDHQSQNPAPQELEVDIFQDLVIENDQNFLENSNPIVDLDLPGLPLFDDQIDSLEIENAMSIPNDVIIKPTKDFTIQGVSSPSIDLPFPESWTSCDCADESHHKKPSSMWHSVSQTLMKWKTQNLQSQYSNIDHDIAVRAISEGWDTIDEGEMSASWHILRQIDGKVWAQCRPVDRLAVLCTMNLLLQCHLNPCNDNLSRLPPWYRPRPSQVLKSHFYAIDFFVWPGLRERFVYHPHKYCSDKFWAMMAQHFRFIWPYDFRDCYVNNHLTGEYHLSELFQNRLKDLASFTFCKDMFNSFPEFEGDIPKFLTINAHPLARSIHDAKDEENVKPRKRQRSSAKLASPISLDSPSQWEEFSSLNMVYSMDQSNWMEPSLQLVS